MNTLAIRIAGFFALISTVWCGPWLLLHLNVEHLWMSVPFTIALALTMGLTLTTFVTEWRRSTPPEVLAPHGSEPVVGILIPTMGEPIQMISRTVESVLGQEWPIDRMVLVISDDAHSPEVANEVQRLQTVHPGTTVLYHSPPRHGSPERRGNAKAGNLNAAFDMLRERFPDIAYIETRDADDEVGDSQFLRRSLGLHLRDPRLAYTQTVKSANVSEGDPFNNLEPLFYYGNMLARHDGNSVFPCGSGLVWKREALEDIGGFPAWSLVEDLMSGVEALKRSWRGAFIPIIGAVAQHAPEDIPNVYKQRGTWALDTMRIMFWNDLSGLNLRQKIQLSQLAMYYLHSFASLIFIAVLPISLVTHIYPMDLSGAQAVYRFWPLIVSSELFLLALNGRQPFERTWRLREMLTGLAPVYAKSCFLALIGGPDRTYPYRVTRKTDAFSWYWRETLVQSAALLVLTGALLYRIFDSASFNAFDMGLAYIALLQILPLAGFVRKSWYGVDVGAALSPRRQPAIDTPRPTAEAGD